MICLDGLPHPTIDLDTPIAVPDDFPQHVTEERANVYVAGKIVSADQTIHDGFYVALANRNGFPLELQVSDDGQVKAVSCNKHSIGFDHNDKSGFRCLKDDPSLKTLEGSSTKHFKLVPGTSYDFLVCIRKQNLEVLVNGKQIFSGKAVDLHEHISDVYVGGFNEVEIFQIENVDKNAGEVECSLKM